MKDLQEIQIPQRIIPDVVWILLKLNPKYGYICDRFMGR